MTRGRQWMELALGVLLGLSIGLAVSWWLAPNASIDLSPAALRSDSKDEFRLLVSSAYDATGDLGRAQARLALLQDADMVRSLIDQALRFQSGQSHSSLYPEDPEQAVYVLANLANSLQQAPVEQLATPSMTIPSLGILPTATYLPFELVSRESICDENDSMAMARFQVRASSGLPLPGVEILVTWQGGRQHFYTGLKPELGYGYADFIMIPGVQYFVQVMPSSTILDDLTAPECPAEDGNSYPGDVLLVYEQP